MESQRKVQQKRPGLNLQTTTTRQLKLLLEEIFITHRIIAFERYNFICRKQQINELLEQFHADPVELASRADCGDKENEWVRDMFTANMNNKKIAEELLAETRTPQETYEYAIRREKCIEHSKTMKLNPIGTSSSITIKQDLWDIYNPEEVVADRSNYFRTTIKEDTQGADKTKTQEEINPDDHKITPHKNNVTNVETRFAQIIYNHVQLKTKTVQNVQNADTSQKCAVRIN